MFSRLWEAILKLLERKVSRELDRFTERVIDKLDGDDEDKKEPEVAVSGIPPVSAIPIEEVDNPKPIPKPPVEVTPQPPSEGQSGMAVGHYVGTQWNKTDPYNNYEPYSSGRIGLIETFLWKPTSDKGGPVVVVTCDAVPRHELYIEINGQDEKNICVPGVKSRGNRLPPFKYGRVNFYLRYNLEQLKVWGDLRVKFYQNIAGVGKRYVQIKIKGKEYGDTMVVKTISNRIDIR